MEQNTYNATVYSQTEKLLSAVKMPGEPAYLWVTSSSVQFSSVAQSSCMTLCDPKDRNMPGLPVHHQLLELTQTHVH